MARTRPAVVTLAALFVLPPFAAEGQTTMMPTWQPEVGGSLAWGHTVRFGDQTFGDTPNLGLTLGARHETGLGFEVEVNKTFGLTPDPVACSGVVPCIGEAFSGVRTEHLSVRPELRVYDSSALSRSNLTLVRASVGIGVNW
jgi:hypothetical protein